jgi:ABC-type uncharacterized transport system YnjBCD ATPase subunit
MKKVFMIITAISLYTAVALAGPVDRELPETTPLQIRDGVRQMIDQGFNAEKVTEMTRQMLASHFREQQILQAQAVLMDARRQGLPTEPVMSKANEGLAKQVRAEAVVKAMEQVRSRYEFATQQAGVITNDKARISQMAAVLAGSMAAGMNSKDAGRIMQVLRERTRNMARTHSEELAMQTLMTTQTMARLGMQSQSVGDSVCQALQQGYTAQQMHSMRNTMMTSNGSRNSDFGQPGGQSSGMGDMGGHGADSGGGMGGGSGGGGGGMGGGHM